MIVAVNVTLWPTFAGFDDDVTVVVDEVAAELIVRPAEPVLVAKLPSPEYVAEIVWLPAVNPFVVREADPAASGTVPSSVLPSKNWMLLVVDPAPGATTDTFAVNVTG